LNFAKQLNVPITLLFYGGGYSPQRIQNRRGPYTGLPLGSKNYFLGLNSNLKKVTLELIGKLNTFLIFCDPCQLKQSKSEKRDI